MRESTFTNAICKAESKQISKDFAYCEDTISRQAALDAMDTWDKFGCGPDDKLVRYDDDKHYIPYVRYEDMVHAIKHLPSAQPEIIRCKDCKYFELDHFEKVDEFPIPIIVAHEICMKWSGGCKSSVDGWCFMAERRTDETD